MSQTRYCKRNKDTKRKTRHISCLENTVHDIGADSSTGTEDCCNRGQSLGQHRAIYNELTRIAQFFAKLLAILLELALLLGFIGSRARSTLADSQRHISVIGRWRLRVDSCFLIKWLDITLGEDALLAGTLIATTPPYICMLALGSWGNPHFPKHTVSSHVLQNQDSVIRRQRQIAFISWIICPHRRGDAQRRCGHGRGLGVCWWCLRRRGGVLIIHRGLFVQRGIKSLRRRGRVWGWRRLRLNRLRQGLHLQW